MHLSPSDLQLDSVRVKSLVFLTKDVGLGEQLRQVDVSACEGEFLFLFISSFPG